MSLDPTRRFARIPEALARACISRSRLYQLFHEHPGLLRKFGRCSLVDLDVLDTILDGLPVANLKAAND